MCENAPPSAPTCWPRLVKVQGPLSNVISRQSSEGFQNPLDPLAGSSSIHTFNDYYPTAIQESQPEDSWESEGSGITFLSTVPQSTVGLTSHPSRDGTKRCLTKHRQQAVIAHISHGRGGIMKTTTTVQFQALASIDIERLGLQLSTKFHERNNR